MKFKLERTRSTFTVSIERHSVQRKVLIPTIDHSDDENEMVEISRKERTGLYDEAAKNKMRIVDQSAQISELESKIKQLESVIEYGVEFQKMVPRFEMMKVESQLMATKAEVEQLKFQLEEKDEKIEAILKAGDLPTELRFMEPDKGTAFEKLAEQYNELQAENAELKRTIANARKGASLLRMPQDSSE